MLALDHLTSMASKTLNLFSPHPLRCLSHRIAAVVVNVLYVFKTGRRCHMGFPGVSAGKESICNSGDLGLIPGLERSSGEGNSYPLQYFGLENSMDCIVHGLAKSRTRLSDFHFCLHRHRRPG